MNGIKTGSHVATDLSPVHIGAAPHFDLSIPNFGIQEHMPHNPLTDEVFPHAYTFKDGMMNPGESPGHGVEIDERLAEKFPYKRAYLPVCRLEDGTLHNW
jgi:mannonate dehydratase